MQHHGLQNSSPSPSQHYTYRQYSHPRAGPVGPGKPPHLPDWLPLPLQPPPSLIPNPFLPLILTRTEDFMGPTLL